MKNKGRNNINERGITLAILVIIIVVMMILTRTNGGNDKCLVHRQTRRIKWSRSNDWKFW